MTSAGGSTAWMRKREEKSVGFQEGWEGEGGKQTKSFDN